jgi:hypothetical protein
VGAGVPLEAVDLTSLLPPADREQGVEHAAQLDQPERRHHHRGDPRHVG